MKVYIRPEWVYHGYTNPINAEEKKNRDSQVNESKVNFSYYISSSLDSSDEENSECEDEVPESPIVSIPVQRICNKKSTLKLTNNKTKRGSVETSKYRKNVNFCLNEKKEDTLNESYFFSKKRNTTSLASIRRFSQFKQNSSFQSKKSGKESNDKLRAIQDSKSKVTLGYKPNKIIIDNNKTKKEGEFILNKIEHNNNILIFKPPSSLQ